MQRSDFKIFLKKKVVVNVRSGNGSILNYHGSIKSLNADHMVFLDKFDMAVLIMYDVITSICEVGG